jgi:Tfp pilus assembly protein PilV
LSNFIKNNRTETDQHYSKNIGKSTLKEITLLESIINSLGIKKMLKITGHIKNNKTPPAQGFTMLEVLMGIMMTSAFVAATLQLLAINAMFKVKAEREAQALFWIQEDKELIQANSSTLKSYFEDTLSIPETTHQASHCNNPADPYSASLWRRLTNQPNSATLVGGDSTFLLKQGPVTAATKNIINKPYELRRTYTIEKADPDKLKIDFVVVDLENEQAIAGGSTIQATNIDSVDKVIPEVTYECP